MRLHLGRSASALTLICVLLLFVSYAQAQTRESPITPGGAIRMPERTKFSSPAIPPGLEVRGVVAVELLLDPNGDVADVHVIRSIPQIDALVVAAVRQWKYAPTTFAGKPAWVKLIATVQVANAGTVPVPAAPTVPNKEPCTDCQNGEYRASVQVEIPAAGMGSGSCGTPSPRIVQLAVELVDSATSAEPKLSGRPFSVSDKESSIIRLANGRAAKSVAELLSYSSASARCVLVPLYLPKTAVMSRFQFAVESAGGEAQKCVQGTTCGGVGQFFADTPLIVPTKTGHLFYSVYASRTGKTQRAHLVVFYKELVSNTTKSR